MEDESEDLGLDEYFHGQGVCLVEWAHLIEEQLRRSDCKLSLKELVMMKERSPLQLWGIGMKCFVRR